MSPEVERVRNLFVAAVKLPPEQWESFLKEACDDGELRRQAIDLLREHQQAGNFLDRPAARVPDTGEIDLVANGAGAAAALEVPGTTIGPYKLLELIGEGGMGEVWMAEQREPIQRQVALKIIKVGMDTRQVVARFEAERQALALMDHPNIAKVLDGGATSGSRPYFVMELVKGVPITPYCDEHRLTPRERLELFLPVCQAIQHAHTKGIIHRDLKPANVLVAPYDGAPVPKVIDFGVAKATGQRLTERTLFTGFGTVVGTLEYMSPEQAELNNQDIDTRSDIYSLGVLLYELLTGTTPLSHERLKQTAFTEMLRAIREEEPPKPSTRLNESKDSLPSVAAQRHTEPARLTKEVRGELDWIVMKALEKDRSRRYETANAFALDVQRYLADEPVQACPPTFGYRLRKLVRRNKEPVVAVSLVFLALVAGIIGTTWGLVRAEKAHRDTLAAQRAEAARAAGERRAREAEAAQRLRAEANSRLAVSAVDEIMTAARQRLTLYASDQPLSVPNRREKLEHELLQKGLDFYEQLAQTNATDWAGRRARAEAYKSVGRLQLDMGNYAESEKAYGQAVRLLEELARERPNDFDNAYDFADTYLWFCRPYQYTGRFQQAEEVTRHALAVFEKLAADFSDFPDRRLQAQRGVGRCQRNLVLALQKGGKPQQAAQTFQEFLATWAELVVASPDAPDPPDYLALAHYDFACALQETGNAAEAEKAFRQAITLWEKLGAGPPARREYRHYAARTCGQLADLLLAAKRTSEAEQFSRRSVESYAKLAADFPAEPAYRDLQAGAYGSLGALLENTGRMAEAEPAYRQAITLWEKLVAQWPDKREYQQSAARALSGLAERVYAARPAQAEESHRRALALYAKLAADYPEERMYRQWQAGGTWRLGALLQSAGRPAEAEFAFRQAVAFYEKLLADYPRDAWFRSQLAYTCSLLSGLLRSTGRAHEGETACRQAVANQEELVAEFPDHAGHRSSLLIFLGELAEDLLQQGKHAEAAKVAERMAETLRKDPKAKQTAATVLARCVPLAEKDTDLSEADRKALAKSYADCSQELQREAAKQREQKTATTDEKPKQ